MSTSNDGQKKLVARLFAEAWQKADSEGIENELIAGTALSAALASLVKTHGREPAAKTVERLAEAIRSGRFDGKHSEKS